MQLTLNHIRRLSRFSLLISFTADGTPYQTIAAIQPRQKYAIHFSLPEMPDILRQSPHQAPLFTNAIAAFAKGQKLQLPLKFPAATPARPPIAKAPPK